MTDPMEQKIADALNEAGIPFDRGQVSGALDFWIPTWGIHIEVKQFHTERIAKQMSRAANVIVAQGSVAVEQLAEMIALTKGE